MTGNAVAGKAGRWTAAHVGGAEKGN